MTLKTFLFDFNGIIINDESIHQQLISAILIEENINLSDLEYCLAIKDSLAGIQAAKRAGMKVVGVANTYPFHMLQRLANWSIDSLCDLEIERVKQVFAQFQEQVSISQC